MAEQERQFSRGKSDALTCEQFYDLYSPAVYGDILKTISDTRVAGQVLYEVFIHFFRHRRELNNSPLLPLTQLLNIARKESQKAIQPFRLFKVCGTDTSNPLQKISARQ